MTHSDILRRALEMSIDELQQTISLYTSAIDIMNEVKRIRIRDGERTAEMIKRQARRNAAKKAAAPDKLQQKTHTINTDSATSVPASHPY